MNGLLAKKIGMTQIFDDKGEVIAVTVVEGGPCLITQVKTKAKDGYSALQLSYAGKKREIRSANSGEVKVGQELKVDLFKPGDSIRVTGKTIGKGFQGTVKRFHTHRGPMTHGSKSHRIPGSIGSGTTPGRVWKGRKMPGRMGGGTTTIKKTTVVQVLPEQNLLLIRGAIPGKRGNLLMIRKNG